MTVSLVNPQYKCRELGYQLEDTGASVVVTHPALRSVVTETFADSDRDPTVISVGDPDQHHPDDVAYDAVRSDPVTVTVDCAPEDVALLPSTSSTTGKPKGVRLTHRNFAAQLDSYLSSRDDEVADTEVRSLCYLPLYHITGFTHFAMQPLVSGGTLYLRNPSDWSAETALDTIEAEGITHFVGVTAMYVDMVGAESFEDHDLSSLVRVSEGGAKMSVAV